MLIALVLIDEDHPVIWEAQHLLGQGEIDSRLPDVSWQWPLQVPPDTVKVIDLLALHGFFMVIPQEAWVFKSKSSLAYRLYFYQRVEIGDGPILVASDEVLILTIERYLLILKEGLWPPASRATSG